MPTRHHHTATTFDMSSPSGAGRVVRSLVMAMAGSVSVLVSVSALAEDAAQVSRGAIARGALDATSVGQGEALPQEALAEIRGRFARELVPAIDEGLGVILWDERPTVPKGGGGGNPSSRHEASGYRNHQSQTVTTMSR